MNFEAGLIPLKWQESQAFVEMHHRHSKPLKRHIFSIGVSLNGLDLNGVATVDRCSGAWSSRKDHMEVRRLCTDGTKNLGSFLLGKASTACFAMGAKIVFTYTQPQESCSTQLADNWNVCGISRRKGSVPKIRWYKESPHNRKLDGAVWFPDGRRYDAQEYQKQKNKAYVDAIRQKLIA